MGNSFRRKTNIQFQMSMIDIQVKMIAGYVSVLSREAIRLRKQIWNKCYLSYRTGGDYPRSDFWATSEFKGRIVQGRQESV